MKSTGNPDAFSSALVRYRRYVRSARPDSALRVLAEAILARGIPARKRLARSALPGASGLLFKFYGPHRHFDAWRASRARLAFAAGRVLADAGAPSVEVVGFVEGLKGPYASCLVLREIPGAVNVREWLKRHHGCMTAETWRNWREGIYAAWKALSDAGIYHDDTKALNLITAPEWSEAPAWLRWTDLESVHPGRRPTRWRIIRNLVQLNGSLRKWVPDEERFRFLALAKRDYPWLDGVWVVPLIRRWTRRRLMNELKTRCGP